MLEHVSYESHQGKKYILKSTKTDYMDCLIRMEILYCQWNMMK